MSNFTDIPEVLSDPTEVTLMAVGDIMLGDSPICVGHGLTEIINKKGSEFLFGDVSTILNKGDIVFGNLECVLSDIDVDQSDLKSVQLRGAESSVTGLVYAGFNVLSLANNHILEHGENSLLRTKEVLSNCGIYSIGVSESKEKSRESFTLNINNLSVSFLSYCLVKDNTAYCSVDDPSEIINDIQKIKDKVDILIVSLHWGDEFVRKPSSKQVQFAHEMIDSGANIILGHHPHVLQGLEAYNNGIVVYSLGNFVFDMRQKKMRESMIFSCRLAKSGVIDYEIIPVLIENFKPSILNGPEKDNLLFQITNEFPTVIPQKMYDQEINKCIKQYRKDLISYLIFNFYKYKPIYLWQIFVASFKRNFLKYI